ncbi:hypothetical protein P154DRAFT_118377 [Amniculicola lignicola CBS 123094]|uniref:Uncharacterized protein n=1 Tax=Amniculicola lignicola CBS 123094 TaxID=1392246 RepID=A0A6A5X387_9PLEO|nr:hypothetical protein P154DRAFT_118377 [Amniculicola lignicola CBS 123094]
MTTRMHTKSSSPTPILYLFAPLIDNSHHVDNVHGYISLPSGVLVFCVCGFAKRGRERRSNLRVEGADGEKIGKTLGFLWTGLSSLLACAMEEKGHVKLGENRNGTRGPDSILHGREKKTHYSYMAPALRWLTGLGWAGLAGSCGLDWVGLGWVG